MSDWIFTAVGLGLGLLCIWMTYDMFRDFFVGNLEEVEVGISFKSYESKPIIRKAYEVQAGDQIVKTKEKEFVLSNASGQVSFVAHEPVMPGDFIVYLNDQDIYHCSRQVFSERNVIEGKQ